MRLRRPCHSGCGRWDGAASDAWRGMLRIADRDAASDAWRGMLSVESERSHVFDLFACWIGIGSFFIP